MRHALIISALFVVGCDNFDEPYRYRPVDYYSPAPPTRSTARSYVYPAPNSTFTQTPYTPTYYPPSYAPSRACYSPPGAYRFSGSLIDHNCPALQHEIADGLLYDLELYIGTREVYCNEAMPFNDTTYDDRTGCYVDSRLDAYANEFGVDGIMSYDFECPRTFCRINLDVTAFP